MLIEQPHFVHPADVALSHAPRNPAEPDGDRHPDYVANARSWLEQYLIGEYNRLSANEPGRWAGHDEPQIRDLDQPYTDADGRTWQLPYETFGVTYTVGWIGTLAVHENPDWTAPTGA